jgi:hypothetical protein
MADKNFNIDIETTADTSGVKETDKSIEQLGDEVKRLKRDLNNTPIGSREFVDLGEKVAAAKNQLALAEAQVKKFNTELARTGNTSEGVASKLGGPLTGKIQQAGFQIQDFAVQVGGGTSAMTAFGQQAPQFLGAFGPAGSIAGAIIAIGAVAFNVFSKMGTDTRSAKEKLEEMDEAIQQIAKNKTADLNQEFEDTATAFDLASKRAAALKTAIDEVVKSENKLSLAQLDRRASDRENATAAANQKAAEAGKPVDTRRVANDASLRVQERAEELARQGLVSEQARVAAAQEAAQTKAAELKQAEEAQKKALELLATDRARLAVLREKNEELKKAAQERDTDDPGLQILGGLFPKIIPTTKAADEAQKKLNDPVNKTNQAVLEGRIAALEKSITGDDAELNRKVADLSVEVLAAQTNVSNLVQATRNNAAAINLDLGTLQQGQREKLNSTELKGAEQKASQQVNQQLADTLAIIGDAAQSPEVLNVVEKIKGLAANGVDGGEQQEVFGLFQQLLAKSTASTDKNREVLNKVIAVIDTSVSAVTAVNAKLDEQNRRLKALEANAGK